MQLCVWPTDDLLSLILPTDPALTIKRLSSPTGTITACLCPLFVSVGPGLTQQEGRLCAQLAAALRPYGLGPDQASLSWEMLADYSTDSRQRHIVNQPDGETLKGPSD